MRTLRTQKQAKPLRGETRIADGAIFSVFEDFEPKKLTETYETVNGEKVPKVEGYTLFPTYTASEDQLEPNLGAEGIQAVKDFVDDLTNYRYNCTKKGTAFKLYLLVQREEVKDGENTVVKYQEIRFDFRKDTVESKSIEVADLVVEQEDKVTVTESGTQVEKTVLRKIVKMLVDSDTNEALVRFVEKSEWEATTYAILDANVNLGVFKNVHLTLNAPFNCNMKWYVPNRKLVYGYKFELTN